MCMYFLTFVFQSIHIAISFFFFNNDNPFTNFCMNHLSSVCRLAIFVSLQAKVLPHYTFSVWFKQQFWLFHSAYSGKLTSVSNKKRAPRVENINLAKIALRIILHYLHLNTIFWHRNCRILYFDNEFHTLASTNIGIPFSPIYMYTEYTLHVESCYETGIHRVQQI